MVAPPSPILKLTNSETAARRAKRTKIWALCGVVDTSQHVYFDHFRHWLYRGGATAAAAANTEIDCNSKTTGRRAKRMKIWALWGVVDTSQHVYFGHIRHWFHRGGATAAKTEIGSNSKTAGRRAKRSKIWARWGLVDTYHHIYFDRLKHRFHRGGATVGTVANAEID